MLDIKYIRNNAKKVQEICTARSSDADITMLLMIDKERNKLQEQFEDLRNQGNKISGSMKAASTEERNKLIEQGAQIKKHSKVIEDQLANINKSYHKLLSAIPNLMPDDTPIGKEESDNLELEVYGTAPVFNFPAKDHIELGNQMGMDFTAGARVAGSGFPLIRGDLALLEHALLRFVFDQAIAADFTPTNVPLLAKHEVLQGAGFNPRREDEGTEIFSTIQDNLCLAGTAEISLVGQFSGEMIDSDSLPIKMVAMTPCFRREGAYGRRDAGLYRNKMFNKVELVIISDQDSADTLLEEIRAFEVSIFKKLDIHFRLIRICSGDLGAPAYKKYDVEAWMQGRGEDDNSAGWGELTSCSNCTDFQARRLNIRHKSQGGKPQLAYTLNGTGVTTRALIPILEQYQNEDGTVRVPDVLIPYTGGKTVLG